MTTYALLLNASHEPIRVISARRALQLLLSGKADTVEEGERPTVFRSSSGSVVVPAVLRLRNFVKIPYRATVPLNRAAVLARDKKICQFTHCGKFGDTMDHVIPRSRGGKHVWENVVAACKRCNAKKDDKTLEQMGWALTRKPFAPKAWFYVVFKFELDPAWEPYLPQFA